MSLPAEAPGDTTQPHTWWQQFEDELAATPTPSASGERSAHIPTSTYRMSGFNDSQPSTDSHGAAQDEEPKLMSAGLAGACWQSAQQELEVAKVLARSFPAQSVLHSHHAAEQVLKYALLKTCGLTGSEYSGKKAHDLVALVGQLTSQVPDVSQQRLKRLSDAFNGTRYVAFPPTGGSQTPPASTFGTAEADEAYNTALLLVEWAKATFPMYHGFAASASPSGESNPPGLSRQASAGASSADLAAAEARARTAEQEVVRLHDALQAAEGSVDEKVERELRPLRDRHESALEELKREHEEELASTQAEMQKQMDKLKKQVKKLTQQLAIANGDSGDD